MNRLLERSMWHLHRQDGRILPETAAKITPVPGDLLLPHCGVTCPNRCIALQIMWPVCGTPDSEVSQRGGVSEMLAACHMTAIRGTSVN